MYFSLRKRCHKGFNSLPTEMVIFLQQQASLPLGAWIKKKQQKKGTTITLKTDAHFYGRLFFGMHLAHT